MSGSSSADFLFELGTEELPPRALRELEQALCREVVERFDAAGLTHGAAHSYAAPRRLAVLVRALASQQSEQHVRRRGPPVSAAFDPSGAPTRAALAFAESCGSSVAELGRIREGKGEFLLYEARQPGAASTELIPDIIRAALDALPIAKRMRWGSSDAQFVRPVHWLLLRHGEAVIPARILDTDAAGTSRGHRFLAPRELSIKAPADYADTLQQQGYVIADFATRRQQIEKQVAACAAECGGIAIVSDALLDEVTALVEWPVAMVGKFEARFLELPREVLLSTLQDHQRYFAIEDPAGKLLPWFITISNIPSRDPAQVRAGNERVVRPRLSDAAFFWQQDRRQPLAASRPALDQVTYQAKLGSIGARTERVAALADVVAVAIGADRAFVARAAQLAKCDLVSSIVGEFPELQGIMGAYYASADGEAAEVASAIREHYLPRGAGDQIPQSRGGMALALADRLDTLAGIFAIGQKPSGTRDPFGLRRAAIGLLRIAEQAALDIDLPQLVAEAVAAQPVAMPAAVAEVLSFISERQRAACLERSSEGFTTEMFDAVQASGPRSPHDFMARLAALRDFLVRPEAAALAAANKRSANILKKAPPPANARLDKALLRLEAERTLADGLAALREPVHSRIEQRDYAGALALLAELRPLVDSFFEGVMVNDADPDLRRNRLALLTELRALFTGVADLSFLPG